MSGAVGFSFGQLSFLLGLSLSVFPFLANILLHALLLFGTVSCLNSSLQARQELRTQRPSLTEPEMIMKSENKVTNCYIFFLINRVNCIRATRPGWEAQPQDHSHLPQDLVNSLPKYHKTGRTWPKLAHRGQINK